MFLAGQLADILSPRRVLSSNSDKNFFARRNRRAREGVECFGAANQRMSWRPLAARERRGGPLARASSAASGTKQWEWSDERLTLHG